MRTNAEKQLRREQLQANPIYQSQREEALRIMKSALEVINAMGFTVRIKLPHGTSQWYAVTTDNVLIYGRTGPLANKHSTQPIQSEAVVIV